ncbi:hypothetical protein TorRG33x02_056810 [Trema orientale]|uniref:Uncharacterized protein n=1 Tax=Trema orientale TaxID=63057 RepID=A0A2P5FKY0_TREOI|nr:hypothetical protein TorRG33x02_056810 [Trema orientale]
MASSPFPLLFLSLFLLFLLLNQPLFSTASLHKLRSLRPDFLPQISTPSSNDTPPLSPPTHYFQVNDSVRANLQSSHVHLLKSLKRFSLFLCTDNLDQGNGTTLFISNVTLGYSENNSKGLFWFWICEQQSEECAEWSSTYSCGEQLGSGWSWEYTTSLQV